MAILELSFENSETSLSVRRFSVNEELSNLFSVSIWARSPNDDIDISSIVGKTAKFQVTSGLAFAQADKRLWSGTCSHMELVQSESTGLSTYYLRIVPKMWLLAQRTNYRIFQRKNIPDIVDTILSEWQIEPTWNIDRAAYPKFEYRVQYAESDYAWISRLLEEAGISFGFVDDGDESKLTFWDAPQHNEQRPGFPISYVDRPNESSEREFVTNVRKSDMVRPGKLTVRDHDFRRQPQYKLLADTPNVGSIEDKLEQYVYAPGAFKLLQEAPTKAASANGGGEGEEKEGWFDKARDAIVDNADNKVTALVNDEVTELLNKALKDVAGKFAGDIAGELLGGITGEIAGNVAGKLTSDILGGDRDSFDIDLQKILREKMKKVVDGKLAGKVDEKVTKFVKKKLGKLGKLGEFAADAVGDLAKEATKAAGGKAIDAVLGEAKKAAGDAAGKAVKALGPGASASKLALAGDDKGASRHDEKAGKALAQRGIESLRTGKTAITYDTNTIDLRPGTIFCMSGHSSSQISATTKFLVTSFSFDGTPGGEWSMSGVAVFASDPYRPMMKTPKPRIDGLQSAVVVGPAGQEIHTDEHGRVRVQFHWDREGGFNDDSSRWMRVSQGWGGPGFGMISIPRVGTEVIVAFLEGDPDNPLVVGQVYNATSPVPHKLPDNKTVSAWRGNSSPGGGGFNEILFEDMKGKEMLFMQAEKNLRKLVKHDETEITQQNRRITVGANLTKMVTFDEIETIGSDRTVTIGENLREAVGANHALTVGGSLTQQVGQGVSMTVGPNPPPEGSEETPPEDVPAGVMKMDVKERLEITVGSAKLVIDKSGKVELSGVEFDFSASGPVQINGSMIDLN